MTLLSYSHTGGFFNSQVFQTRNLNGDDVGTPVFTDVEQKLLRLALDKAAYPAEVDTCAVKLDASWRHRNITAEQILYSFGEATRIARQLAVAKRCPMPFGKHRGKPLSEIPVGYLRWVLAKCDNAPLDLKRAIRIVLNEGTSTPDQRKC